MAVHPLPTLTIIYIYEITHNIQDRCRECHIIEPVGWGGREGEGEGRRGEGEEWVYLVGDYFYLGCRKTSQVYCLKVGGEGEGEKEGEKEGKWIQTYPEEWRKRGKKSYHNDNNYQPQEEHISKMCGFFPCFPFLLAFFDSFCSLSIFSQDSSSHFSRSFSSSFTPVPISLSYPIHSGFLLFFPPSSPDNPYFSLSLLRPSLPLPPSSSLSSPSWLLTALPTKQPPSFTPFFEGSIGGVGGVGSVEGIGGSGHMNGSCFHPQIVAAPNLPFGFQVSFSFFLPAPFPLLSSPLFISFYLMSSFIIGNYMYFA